jgi:hypothetical protein
MQSLKRAIQAVRCAKADFVAACNELKKNRHFRHASAFIVTGTFLALVPELAHAGLWNGGLCNGYQSIMDNEMAEVISLGAGAGGIVAWLMDDGKSQIKTTALRLGAGTLGLLNLPIIWATIFNHGTMTCTAAT